MKAAIGVDVGTTETKCCAIVGDTIVYEARQPTAPLQVLGQIIYFDPIDVWNEVVVMLRSAICEVSHVSHYVISVACQAPSMCAWDGVSFARGISYLSFYGDPTLNSQPERWSKACRRLDNLIESVPEYCRVNLSGLTGYLVYQLTGCLTIDSVTAWEIGIESRNDERKFWGRVLPHFSPKTYEPLRRLALDCVQIPQSSRAIASVLVGTTDSGVLPLSVWPMFQDYYVYLGTWGSLLQSAIRDEEAFGNQYWSGMLHNWMISVPDMAVRCSSDPSILVSFFEKVAMLVPKGKSIALGGGLVRSFRPMIVELVNTYLPQTPILLAPDASTALSASRLGLIGVTRGRHS